jgi:hypothetical protein
MQGVGDEDAGDSVNSDRFTRSRVYNIITSEKGWSLEYVKSLTFMQQHLILTLILEDRMRANGIDPDTEKAYGAPAEKKRPVLNKENARDLLGQFMQGRRPSPPPAD